MGSPPRTSGNRKTAKFPHYVPEMEQAVVKRNTALYMLRSLCVVILVNFGLQTEKLAPEFRPDHRAATTLGISTHSISQLSAGYCQFGRLVGWLVVGKSCRVSAASRACSARCYTCWQCTQLKAGPRADASTSSCVSDVCDKIGVWLACCKSDNVRDDFGISRHAYVHVGNQCKSIARNNVQDST